MIVFKNKMTMDSNSTSKTKQETIKRRRKFIIKFCKKNKIKSKKTTATSIPMWSPTIVLTGPDIA